MGVKWMPKFEVTVEFTGRITTEVEEADLNEAVQKALQTYNTDLAAVNATGGQVIRILMVS